MNRFVIFLDLLMTNTLIIFCTILLVLFFRIYSYTSKIPEFADGTKIRISTTVWQDPIVYENSQYIKLKGIPAYLPNYPQIAYGDYVVVEGVITDHKLKGATLIQKKDSTNFLVLLREKMLSVYQNSLTQPSAGLIAGVSIGSKSLITNEFWQRLVSTGTVHIVVASGMNITLITKFLMSLFVLVINRRLAVVISSVFVWGYAVVAGLDAPIVRATVMATVAFAALELGRVANTIRILVFTSITMLVIKPDWIFDLGFYLSFISTLCLCTIHKPIHDRFTFLPNVIREDFSTSLAAQIGVTPLLIYFFGGTNFLSPIINTMILWTVVPMTLLGMVGGLVGVVLPSIGTYVLYLVYPLTYFFIFIVEIFT